jgi:putative transposase
LDLARILAYVTGTVDQELLARNEYLAAENRILKAQLKGRLKLSDAERATRGEIGHRVGRKVLAEVAAVARPDTILAWYRKLVACKFDGSQVRHGPGRPRIKREVEQLIVRMAGENRDWGYDRIAGRLGQSRVYDFRSNGWQCSATPCSAARAGAQAHDHVAGLHPNPPGAVGGDRLLRRC